MHLWHRYMFPKPSVLPQVGFEKTRPNKQRAVLIWQVRVMAVPAIGNTCAAGTTTRFSSKCYAPQVPVIRPAYSLIKLFEAPGGLDRYIALGIGWCKILESCKKFLCKHTWNYILKSWANICNITGFCFDNKQLMNEVYIIYIHPSSSLDNFVILKPFSIQLSSLSVAKTLRANKGFPKLC